MITEFGEKTNFEFKKFDYKIKRKISFNYFSELKNSNVRDTLKNDISPKYKNTFKDINAKTLNEVCKISNWLDKFFEIKYIDLFKYYYNTEKLLDKYEFKGKEINFKKTKSFYDLLHKYVTKYKSMEIKEKLIKTADSFYDIENKGKGKISFISRKIIND